MLIERGHGGIYDYGWSLYLTLIDWLQATAREAR